MTKAKLLAPLVIVVALSLALKAAATTYYFGHKTVPPTTLTSTLTLTSANNGQTLNNYAISTTSGPCVIMNGVTGATIKNFQIGPCGTNNSTAQSAGVLIEGGSSGNNVYDSYIHVQNLSSGGGDDHEGILLAGAVNTTIQGNVLAFNETNVEINQNTNTNTVVNGNFLLNPVGPFPRGQQVQFAGGSGGNSNVTIENNRELSCEQSACSTHGSGTGVVCLTCSASTLSAYTGSITQYALQEDANNLAAAGPGNITGNWIEGGDSPSGNAIEMDTGVTGTWTISNNIMKDTGHMCISPAAGAGTISGNKCMSLTDISTSQNGIYVSKIAGAASCGSWAINNNVISVLSGNQPGTGAGSSEACASAFLSQPFCFYNSFGSDGSCSFTQSGDTFDNGDNSEAAATMIYPIATTNPPPLIPPLPKNCVARSPFSTQTSLPGC